MIYPGNIFRPIEIEKLCKFFSDLVNTNKVSKIYNLMGKETKSLWEIFNHILILIGVICALVYFFFSKEHKGAVGTISKIGIYFLMIKFGASFGFAVMGRISLLIGQMNYLIDYSSEKYYYATPILLTTMIICLTLWAFMGKGQTSKDSI